MMIFFSPHRDLQIRTYQAAVRELKTLRREVTPDLIFVSSPDPRVRAKLEDWSTPSLQGIPLGGEEEVTALGLISHIRDYVFTRNLFYETGPVSGDRFFGRRELLQSLRDDILHGRVAGLFGLRKAGKTSVLMQLASDLEGRSIVSVFMDLEAFPSPPDDPTDEILTTLRLSLLEQLRAHGLRTKELAELPASPSIVEFKVAFQALLKRIEGSGDRILLLLDEIEYLTPADAIDVAEGSMPRVAQFLAALRSIAQENSNFTFLLSGLTSAIIESGRLYGRPNPLFSWAKAYYLGPLSLAEASDLAVSVGARMGIELEEKALSALYEASGGHAFLYRNFASTVVQTLPIDVFRRRLTKSIVLSELRDWRARVHGNITEMIAHVTRYYPTESVLLDLLRDDASEFASFEETDPSAVRHLIDLGLVQIEGGEYELNPVLALQ
ncbi:ATP-binding protein [Curtobacterium sp. MCBA15_013]|uniref:ATP-binding protein n=2 Tax=unclassified Curtobacterium TaxID=257496 RepID=UPI0015874715|nr:ATP-binding protein [Curtobacterium sp. MCBA15_013]